MGDRPRSPRKSQPDRIGLAVPVFRRRGDAVEELGLEIGMLDMRHREEGAGTAFSKDPLKPSHGHNRPAARGSAGRVSPDS